MEVALKFAIFTLVCALSSSQDCPIKECRCSPNVNGEGRIIDCRNRNLRQIPYIEKSTEIFKELTFANDNDPLRGICYDCNIFQDIKGNVFKNIKVKAIDLGNTKISRVNRLAFAGQKKNLRRIVVSGDGRSRPPYQALKRLTKLRSLEILYFNIDYLDEKSPILLFPNLQHLRLRAVNLRYIRRASFVNKLQKMKKIEISGNRNLVVFPVGAMGPLQSLQELVYTDNGLKILPYAAFNNLRKLRTLDISDNQIWKLERNCFKSASDRIESLDMKLNQLDHVSVRELTLTKWKRLKTLDLSSNRLAYIPIGQFKNMPKLEVLRIPFNNIKSISPQSFKGLRNLQQLDLSDNNFEKIPPDSFLELSSLTQLSLVAANQDDADRGLSLRGVFNGLRKLETLNLKFTRLMEDDIWREIQNMTSLLYLGLGDTGLTYIPDFVFRKLHKLRSLDLSRNNIQGELTVEQLDGLQYSLEKLDLKFDRLNSISNGIFEQFTSLKLIFLYGNPLQCECNLKGLNEWLLKMNSTINYIASAVCASPPEVKNEYVSDVNLSSQCLKRSSRVNIPFYTRQYHTLNNRAKRLSRLLTLFDKKIP